VRVLPAPVRVFSPPKPGVVRLPVEIVFPSGGDIFQHVANFFKGGIKQLMPDMYKLPGLNLKPRVGDLWERMQVPIYLDKGVWLLIRPETLSIGVEKTDLKKIFTVHTVLEMTAQPEVLFGPKPTTTHKLLPELKMFKPGPPIFQAISNARISYKEVNQYLSDPRLKIVGRVIPGTGERKLTLEGVRLYGSGGKVVVEVKLQYNPPIINFTGKPAKLTVYLKGTPRYLPQQRVFYLPDLDFDIKSSDLLVQLADWIFKSDIRNDLKKVARLPIGPKMDLMKAKMEKALNRPLGKFNRLETRVNSFRVLDGFADNEGLQVRLAVQGTALMEVTWN
jgi:hypothetical protein